MTREEAIEIFLNRGFVNGLFDGDRWRQSIVVISKWIEQEPKTGHWIPVSERLPEIHQYVLLSLRSLDIEVGFRAETEPYFYCHGADGCYIEPQNVIAWQPLPEPYKKGGEE